MRDKLPAALGGGPTRATVGAVTTFPLMPRSARLPRNSSRWGHGAQPARQIRTSGLSQDVWQIAFPVLARCFRETVDQTHDDAVQDPNGAIRAGVCPRGLIEPVRLLSVFVVPNQQAAPSRLRDA